MKFPFRRGFRIAPGIRVNDYATPWAGRNGLPFAVEVLAVLLVVLAALLLST